MATRFNFAWVESTDNVFNDSHKVEDEEVVSFVIDHGEGDFASLSLVVRNPRIGLLTPARKTFAWLSWGDTPLFFGRLVGIPNDIHQELVTLLFTARPVDFVAQKQAVADTLKVLPFYDRVWLAPDADSDPDAVLEAYPCLWHIDRTAGVVSTSDILVGEDGLEEFFEDEVPYDSVRVTIGQVPIRAVQVDGVVTWDQQATGALDLGNSTVLTYTGGSLISDWPKPDKSLGGGWKAVDSFALDNYNIANTEPFSYSVTWASTAAKHSPGDTLSTSISSTVTPVRGGSKLLELTLHTHSGIGEARIESTSLRIPLWSVTTGLTVGYDASRKRKEHVRFTLSADMQPIVTLPGDAEVLILNQSGTDVGIPLSDSEVPIDELSRRSYFSTDRGLRSLEYLLLLARTRLLMASRAVSVEFTCRFQRATALTCRKSGRLFDRRLPGGEATGKIIRYTITGDGDSGVVLGSVTLGCAVGHGGTIETIDGDPLYVTEGYVDHGYQAYTNQVVVFDTGDLGYTVPVDAPNDDGLSFPLTRSQVVTADAWHGSTAEQAAAIDAAGIFPDVRWNSPLDRAPPFDAAKEIPVRIEAALKDKAVWRQLDLKGLDGGPFETVYTIDVSGLKIPQGIDLEAGDDFAFSGPGDDFMTWGPDEGPMYWR